MIKLILLLAAALSPNSSFTHPERGKFEADVFAINTERDTEQTLALLTSMEEPNLESTISTVQIAEDDEMTVTTLRDADGLSGVAYLYRLDVPETKRAWVCRVRFHSEPGPGLERTLRWCLSWIGGDEYRPTVNLRTD